MNEAGIIALTAFVTGFGTWLINFLTTRQALRTSAKKDEYTLLREEVLRLHMQNEEWRTKQDITYEELMEVLKKNVKLRGILTRNNIEIPSNLNGDSDPRIAAIVEKK